MIGERLDLTRITLAVLFIGAILATSIWILLPFLPAIIWATTLVVASWPLMLWVQRHTGNRRGLAALILTLVLLLILIVPFWLAISAVAANTDEIGRMIQTVLSLHLPPPPAGLADFPLIGARATEIWTRLSAGKVESLAPQLAPYTGAITQWIAATAGSLGSMFVHFLLTTLIAAILYLSGEKAAATMIRFGRRLAGDRGEMAVRLAAQAIRSVALGVVVTAVAQSALAGIGLAVVGIPFASVLTAIIFLLCLIQLGPALVMVPAVAWMYYSGDAFWATVLVVFTIIAATMDQLIRPALIRRGADLPVLLILAGVIGGLIAFGMLGIFIGPTVLGVAYTLLNAWMEERT
ncbi:membrane protein [Kaistia sp. 32K]|uniref:AI-2E family transporter YdiK n=1 Tax=Kaistia sp. 32K TaxID=2795690 RepID=UPI001915D3DE|nr:AI-2E family transporter YdiK [Kaistia sp. 32K]BCP55177.1 membrane protein [Kaistia sp. 32K]